MKIPNERLGRDLLSDRSAPQQAAGRPDSDARNARTIQREALTGHSSFGAKEQSHTRFRQLNCDQF